MPPIGSLATTMASHNHPQQQVERKRLESDLALAQKQGSTQGITLEPIADTLLREWTAEVHFAPEHYPGSPYEGGRFQFSIVVPDTDPTYPWRPPRVICKTKIYSPHVNGESGEVFFSALADENWTSALHLHSMMFLLIIAFLEPEDGYQADDERMAEYVSNKELFWERAKEWTGLYASE